MFVFPGISLSLPFPPSFSCSLSLALSLVINMAAFSAPTDAHDMATKPLWAALVVWTALLFRSVHYHWNERLNAVLVQWRVKREGLWIFRCCSPGLFLAHAPFTVSRQRPLARRPTVGLQEALSFTPLRKTGLRGTRMGEERAVGARVDLSNCLSRCLRVKSCRLLQC